MLEVLAPAGSSEALVAAVQNGADAVYLGYGQYNARINAKNFTEEQLRHSVSYCHVRGVKVYLTLNTLVLDKELKEVSQCIAEASQAGVDAILVQDMGVVGLIKKIAPDVPIHASTQMAIHSLSGVQKAAEMGLSRVVLARELSRTQIAAICRESPIEVEVFVHGALCMCHSGMCYMSAMIGRRSGNRGQCAQPCRMTYGYDRSENRYPLSLRDNCLLPYVQELEAMGVACIKIEGRMKRPEYVALATQIYKDAARGLPVTEKQMQNLRKVFSREGFTEAYYLGRIGRDMYGTHQEDQPDRELFSKIRRTYEGTETQRVPVRFLLSVRYGNPVRLQAVDDKGNAVSATGPAPQRARTAQLTADALVERLRKTGGTPYYTAEAHVELDPGLMLSAADINGLRRDVLSKMTAVRGRTPTRKIGEFARPAQRKVYRGKPVYTISVTSLDQVVPELEKLKPAVLYVPVHLLTTSNSQAAWVCDHFNVVAELPRVIKDDEWSGIVSMLAQAKMRNVREVLIGNLGMIDRVRLCGMDARGDYGLNITNSGAANFYALQGLKSITASFELTLPQIRDLSKPVPMEMLAYGRLPLMETENCIIFNRGGNCICGSSSTSLVDRTGSRFPVIKDGGTCRSMVLNSRKLYLGDKTGTIAKLGIWGMRLSFTIETPQQVGKVADSFLRHEGFDPGVDTRGLYTRGVE